MEGGKHKRRYDMKKLFRKFIAAASLAILAVSMSACSGDDDVVVVKPAAPTGVAATFDSITPSSALTLTWDPVPVAASYNVYYSTDPAFTLLSGTKITGATSPHVFTAGTFSDNTTYYFAVTTVNSAGTESLASLKVSAIHPTFTQADLDGPWYLTVFRTNSSDVTLPDFDWLRMRVNIAAITGVATIESYNIGIGNITDTTIPAGNLTFTMDAAGTGIVAQGGDFGGLDSHNVMSSNGELIVGTYTVSPTVKEIRIFQRADAIGTISPTVLSGKNFVFHQLETGLNADEGWSYGGGSVDAGGVVTLTSLADQLGVTIPPGPPQIADTLTITTDGVVTSPTTDTNFLGFMSRDGNLIIGTTRNDTGTAFQLRVIQVAGGTFNMGDLAGLYNYSTLFGGISTSLWQYGTLTINSLGVTTDLSYLDSTGSTTLPGSVTLSMDAAGIITNAANPTIHGAMSLSKDLMVFTFSSGAAGSELYGLSLAVK